MTPPSYISADSAPPGYAVRRSVWLSVLFLAAFLALVLLLDAFLKPATSLYAHLLAATTGATYPSLMLRATLSLRPYVLLFVMLLGLFAPAPARARARFVASTSLAFVAITVATDTLMADNRFYGAPLPLKPRGGVLAVVVELAFLVWIVFSKYHLPAGVTIERAQRPLSRYSLTLMGAVIAVGAVVFLTLRARTDYMRAVHLPLINGFAASVVVFLFGTEFLLFLIGSFQKEWKPETGPSFSVAFVIPAHNEARNIAAVVAALDAAASAFDRPVRAFRVLHLTGVAQVSDPPRAIGR